jgi:hypothetical protein
MTESTISSTIESMFDASRRLRARDHSSTTFAFGEHIVEMASAHHHNVNGISLEGAFHTSTHTTQDSFRLTVIDDGETGCRPSLDWPTWWFEPFGIVRPELTGDVKLALDIHSQSLCAYDPRSREAVVWFHDIRKIFYWFAATPFRLQLSWFADAFDGEMIHAAAIEVGPSAALLVGPTGAGKSTLTLSAMCEGSRILGDDFSLLDGISCHPIYRRTKFHDATMSFFDHSIDAIGTVMNAGVLGEKRIVDTNDKFLCPTGLPIAAVFVPRIGDRAQVRSIPESRAVHSTLGPTMMGLLGGSHRTLQRIVSLVRAVPTYEIEVGPNMADNARLLIDTVQELNTGSGPVGTSASI